MKIFKLFLLSVVVMAMASCEDEKTWNTASDVTVEMAQPTYETREGRKLAKVPVKVIGDANGPIKVTFDVEEAGDDYPEAAFEDVHYFLTEKSIVIDPEDKEAYLEFTVYNDKVINEARSFIVTIENADGATIGNNAQCVVSILDNDDDAYSRLGGIWNMTYVDDEGVEQSVRVEIDPALEDDPKYHRVLEAVGGYLSGDGVVNMKYIMNSEGRGTGLGFNAGSVVASNVVFGSYGECDVITSVNGSTFTGYLDGTWNEDFTEITFRGTIYLMVRTTPNSTGSLGPNVTIGTYDSWTDIKLTFVDDF